MCQYYNTSSYLNIITNFNHPRILFINKCFSRRKNHSSFTNFYSQSFQIFNICF